MGKRYKAPKGYCRVKLEARTDEGGEAKFEAILESSSAVALVKLFREYMDTTEYKKGA